MDEMSLVSPDGLWWWDGQQWVPTHREPPEPAGPEPAARGVHLAIPISRSAVRRYERDIEPPEIRARFGAAMFAFEFALTLPAAFVGTIFSMAVATGQAPPWPTIGEGAFFYLVVLGFFGAWPAIGYLVGFGIRDGARWVFLALASSGAVPALFLGAVMVFGASGAPASDLLTMEVALAWMWALPALGLALLRVTGTGRPLPPAAAFLRMFGQQWREDLPGMQTQWGELKVASSGGYLLRVPGAEFGLPDEARDAVLAAGGRARVTYDLQRGRIEMIEVGA